jgi:cytochrome c
MRTTIIYNVLAGLFLLSAFPAAAEGDVARGMTVFKRCSACHAATDANKVGPGLLGVVGRKAGTVPNYKYSEGLGSAGITWDDTTLDAYLAAVANVKDRQDVIAYLKTLTP